MEETAQIAAAVFERVSQIPEIALVKFSSHFCKDDLQRLTRTPVLLISPPVRHAASSRHRVGGGNQLLLDTFLISRNRRPEGDVPGALELLKIIDRLDAAMVNQTLGLAIEPLMVYRREPMAGHWGGDSSLTVVRTIYTTIIFNRLARSRFVYTDLTGREESIDFELVASAGQVEKIQDSNDYARSLGGELRYYRRLPKKQARVEFSLIPTALKDRLQDMKQAGTAIVYYRDKEAGPTMTCCWMNDFDFVEERPGFWTGALFLQEV